MTIKDNACSHYQTIFKRRNTINTYAALRIITVYHIRLFGNHQHVYKNLSH